MADALSIVSETRGLAEELASIEMDTEQALGLLAETVGLKAVTYLKSITEERRPPARAGEGDRYAHPGHWADITGQLVNAYYYTVTREADGWTLTIGNTAEYAVHLEYRDGFFVIGPLFENEGPIAEAFRAGLAVLGEGWGIQ